MARLAVAGFFLMCLLTLAHAMHQDLITDDFEDTNQYQTQSGRCQRQIQGTRLNSCRRHLQPYMPLDLNREGAIEDREQCCWELQKVNRDCRCQAIREIARNVGGSLGQQQMQEVRMKAQQLPKACSIQPQYCQINQDNEC